jgi:hypothetical protein
MGFKIIMLAAAQTAFALQIDSPPEIAEQVLAYAKEAGGENKNAILRVSVVKGNYVLKLIDQHNGKTIKATERNFGVLPNAALQNAVFEVFGHPVKSEGSMLGENVKTILLGTGFILSGILLYYSNSPKPVVAK